MTLTVFGWTTDQIAYAKRRHEQFGAAELATDANGIAELRRWWLSNGWPEPLSVTLAGVVSEMNMGWAATAVCAALQRCPGA